MRYCPYCIANAARKQDKTKWKLDFSAHRLYRSVITVACYQCGLPMRSYSNAISHYIYHRPQSTAFFAQQNFTYETSDFSILLPVFFMRCDFITTSKSKSVKWNVNSHLLGETFFFLYTTHCIFISQFKSNYCFSCKISFAKCRFVVYYE